MPPRSRERGSTALELAIIAPVLILLIFVTIQAALFFYGRSVALSAAREGVSQLRLAQDPGAYQAMRGQVMVSTERYASQVGGQALRQPSASSTYDDGAGKVHVKVKGKVISLVPWDWSISQEASGTVERFRTP
ncbi:TadE family protein [Luteipulveratus mongoliensis]|uniref:TadE-like domain-containing protein n=1 Tax=Luteipulveratus mongoliensis TaxID=571913 RepID=A0A0K1JNA5_9MICO|nr:TadE family protein [Luteipulveratus mongoliensis]AKU18065.1 hypothetical protein VV02_23030 [Luteipulveratus mongoliensis]